MSEDELLTSAEVAQILNVPVRWVDDHALRGDVPSLKLGRYRRYRRADIDAWIRGKASSRGDVRASL